MQCAVCDSPLDKQSLNKTCIEYCKDCSSYWFDGNEIIELFNYLLDHQNIINKSSSKKVHTKLETGYCPKCNQIAKPLTFYKKDYTLLKCVSCNGIWIDSNNLSSLLKDWKKSRNGFGKYFFAPNKEPKLIQEGKIFESYIGWREDANPLNRVPYATILLIILNIIGFFIWNPTLSFNKEILFTPSIFLSNPITNWFTIFSSMFIHSDLIHLIGNMIYLFMFGNNVEDRIGHYKFLFLYLFLGIFASIGYAFLTIQPSIPALGASGAVSGILGCYLLLYPKVSMKIYRTFFSIPIVLNIPMWMYLGVWFFGQQLFGIAADIQGIGWYAHLIGFLCGYIIMFLMKRLNYL